MEIDEKTEVVVTKDELNYASMVGLPVDHHLIKAMIDPFDYALKTRSGEIVQFCECKYLGGGWVRLTTHEMHNLDHVPKEQRLAFPAERGVDIRISDIVWVMDAPAGS